MVPFNPFQGGNLSADPNDGSLNLQKVNLMNMAGEYQCQLISTNASSTSFQAINRKKIYKVIVQG